MTQDKSGTLRPGPDQGSQELTEEYIRLRAYEIFERRGGEHGHDIEDWLEAEAEITGKKKAAPAALKPSKAAAA